MFSLLKDAKWTKIEPRASAGTSDLTSDVLDMTGYDSICFVASTGDATSGTVLELQIWGNTANSVSSPTPVELTADQVIYTSTSTTDADSKLLIVDVHKPQYQYVFAILVIDTQNCECDGIYAVQYNAKNLPVTQSSSVIDSHLLGPLA